VLMINWDFWDTLTNSKLGVINKKINNLNFLPLNHSLPC
jgi:hypothetical protein